MLYFVPLGFVQRPYVSMTLALLSFHSSSWHKRLRKKLNYLLS